ncbi:MAG: histidine triad nucleotide-binding protein [Chloroflexota bacterium]
MTEPGCLFCRIVAGELPATKVHEDDLVLAIRDINPVAPTHILLMPKSHVASVADLSSADAELLGALFDAGAELARSEGLEERGYRIVTNVGRDAGQTVDHLHLHLLGGRPMSWPPG